MASWLLNLPRRAYASVRRLLESMFFDRPAGIETARVVDLDQIGLGATGRQNYHATPWLALKRTFAQLQIDEHDVFIDFGCGKGRVIFEAAMHPLRRVIGVEISPQLANIARQNIERSRARLRCPNVEVVTADVLDYEVPDDVTIVYFFDPFHGEIFSTVVEKLRASLRRKPRQLTIIYMDPEEDQTLQNAGAKLVALKSGMRPSRQWSSENAIHIYKLGRAEPEPPANK
jgi:16S rRNA G966 N2-methylase RsmD